MNEAREVSPPWSTRLTWGDLLASTYRVYRQRFWKFFRIGLPIALLTYVFTIVQRTLTHQLPQSIARQSFTMIERHGCGVALIHVLADAARSCHRFCDGNGVLVA
jgi:hypothetical protein